MAASSEQAGRITRALHLVLRCLYNADRKLSFMEIGQMTQLPETEVQASVELLRQHNRAVIDHDERVWLVTHNPELSKHESTAARSGIVEPADNNGDHGTITFRDPPSLGEMALGVIANHQALEPVAPDSRRQHDAIPFRDPPQVPTPGPHGIEASTLRDWRADLIRRPDDALELARIQRSVLDILRTLDTPPEVLQALERIARLLETPGAVSER